MSQERDPADEQQIADEPHDAVEPGEAGPAIDAVGMSEEDPDGPDLDAAWVSTDE